VPSRSTCLQRVVKNLRQCLSRSESAHVSDRELLARYLADQDEGAFAALVKRHGAMVLSIARRVLRHVQDAEDAFQATFLILARKAPSIRKHESVSSWLHSVAFRVAYRLRGKAARQTMRQRPLPDVAQDGGAAELSWREAQFVLDEELNRLDETDRAPLLLCYRQGRTQDEAAQQLGWSLSVFRGRLERARQRLRARLVRRGLSFAAVLLATGVADAGAAAVPASLVSSTVTAATGGALASAGAVSARAAILAQGVIQTMFVSKIKLAALGLLTLTVFGASTGLVAYRSLADEPRGAQAAAQPDQSAKPATKEESELAKLRQEVDRLRRELDRTQVDLKRALDEIKVLRTQALLKLDTDLAVRAAAAKALGVIGKEQQEKKDAEKPKDAKPAASPTAASPDGRVFAVATDKMFSLFEAATGKEMARCLGHKGAVSALVFSGDGKIVASGSKDKTVGLWDVPTGRQLRRIEVPNPVTALLFSGDGRNIIVVEADRTQREFDLATGAQVRAEKKP
jgi:RNA polymerase sigma factor (sigma-70 family)